MLRSLACWNDDWTSLRAESVFWLAAIKPHKPLPVGGPALMLDQRPRLAKREVEASTPSAWLREERLKRLEGRDFTDLLKLIAADASSGGQHANRDGDGLPNGGCRREVDADHPLLTAQETLRISSSWMAEQIDTAGLDGAAGSGLDEVAGGRVG